ncbi:MAG: FecR family protein, partial [Leptospira sp.]|nr:FecR family protein [Leptospira sp.]
KKKANQEKDWSNTVTGAFLFNDDLIRTQEKSAAEINFFKDPTVIITIRENSILKVRQDKVKSGELSFGEIYVNVSDKIKSKESKFNIVTSAAVGGVRGTEYALGVDKDETSKFACYTGMMEVSAQGETVKLPAGYGTYVIKGQAPVKPFLLPGDVKIKMPAGK